MRILVAEDDRVARRLLQAQLESWNYDVLCVVDGDDAWSRLRDEPVLEMAILDWEMPGLDGVEICRRLRAAQEEQRTYVLLCTARTCPDDVAEGLDAGADDYLGKPVDKAELRARLGVGVRTLALQKSLRQRIADLSAAMAHVKQLQGLLPICMHCKRIRDEEHVWQRVESYIAERSDVMFSHGLCDACLREHYPDVAAARAESGTAR